jgi:hypothetical protein
VKPKHFSDMEKDTMKILYMLGMCSREIGKVVGRNPKVVQTWAKNNGIPRPKQGGSFGKWNGSYREGCRIDKNGYREVSSPGHPHARKSGYVFEHRLVVEQYLGRYLTKNEVVHHKDGNKLNNALENLEVFANNAEHLKHELSGKVPNWTPEGKARMGRRKSR